MKYVVRQQEYGRISDEFRQSREHECAIQSVEWGSMFTGGLFQGGREHQSSFQGPLGAVVVHDFGKTIWQVYRSAAKSAFLLPNSPSTVRSAAKTPILLPTSRQFLLIMDGYCKLYCQRLFPIFFRNFASLWEI